MKIEGVVSENAFFIETLLPDAPVDLAKIIGQRFWSEQIIMPRPHAIKIGREQRDFSRRIALCLEDGDDAGCAVAPPLAVAASGGLGDLVQPRLGPPDARKVQIDSGLDEGCRDQAARFFVVQPRTHIGEDAPPVRCILARRQVDRSVQPSVAHRAEQRQRMRPAVDDHQTLRGLAQRLDQRRVLHRPRKVQGGAPQGGEQARWIGRQFAVGRERETVRKARLAVRPLLPQRWLGRGAEHDADTIVARQLLQHGDARTKQRPGNGLRLVQHQHAAGEVVQFAASRGACGEQALEQLDVGGDDHRRRPILRRETQLVRSGAEFLSLVALGLIRRPVQFKGGVVLQHDAIAKDLAKRRRRLIDDRRERNGVDDAPQPVALRMLQREPERGERLAAAGRDGQREDAGRSSGHVANMRQDFGAEGVYRAVGGHGGHMGVETRDKVADNGVQGRPLAIRWRRVARGVESLRCKEVAVDKAREHHPAEQAELEIDAGAIKIKSRSDRAHGQSDLSSPSGIREWRRMTQPLLKRTRTAPIRKTRVVAGYRLGNELMKGEIGPRRSFESKHRPCGRMVN